MMTAAQTRAFAQDCDRAAGLLAPHFGQAAARLLGRIRAPIASLYAELRLGGARHSAADLLFAFDHAHVDALVQQLEDQDSCRGLARLCELWATPGTIIHENVPTIWLELDELGPDGPRRAPSISVCLIPEYRRWSESLPPRDPPRELELITVALEALRGRASDAGETQRLVAVLEASPPGTRFIHLSVMLGREPCTTKLYARVPRAMFATFLTAAGWRGPSPELAALIDDLAPPQRVGEELYLDLTLENFDAPGGSRLGLAFAQQHLLCSEERDPSRVPLLMACRRRGLCHDDEVAALAAWAGRERRSLPSDGWASFVQRWLDLKLVWERDVPLQLKAYLGWSARAASIFDKL